MLLLINRATMHEILLQEEKRLCRKYNVSTIEEVLQKQKDIISTYQYKGTSDNQYNP